MAGVSLRSALGVVVGCACTLANAYVYAQDARAPELPAQDTRVQDAQVASVRQAGPYETKTDAELTLLTSQWESLDQEERRALLTEVRSRMAHTGKRPVMTIKAQRRYGRIVRDAEGNQVRIETTHVVRYRQIAPRGAGQPFGVGFEQRQVVSDDKPPESPPRGELDASLPVIQVGTPARSP